MDLWIVGRFQLDGTLVDICGIQDHHKLNVKIQDLENVFIPIAIGIWRTRKTDDFKLRLHLFAWLVELKVHVWE